MGQFSLAYQDRRFKIQKRNFHLELDTNNTLEIQKTSCQISWVWGSKGKTLP
jgi:hypothetical protein